MSSRSPVPRHPDRRRVALRDVPRPSAGGPLRPMRILVVDDQADYRDAIAHALRRQGHEVQTAGDGRRAIARGLELMPDLVIADWVLPDRVHGLLVAAALRLLWPQLSLILISAYASSDLWFEASQIGAAALLDKPFTLERMQAAVAAAGRWSEPQPRSPVAMVISEPDGTLRYANPAARLLFASTPAGAEAGRWQELLPRWRQVLRRAHREWVEVRPRHAGGRRAWQLRGRPTVGGQLHVILDGDEILHFHRRGRGYYSNELLVHLLLDLIPEGRPRWPFPGQALVVDGSALFRRLAATEIERAGGLCHTAATGEAALELIARDPDISVVLLDGSLVEEDDGELLHELRRRPGMRIVGQALDGRQASTLAARGVSRVVSKPWAIEDLLRALDDAPAPS